MGLKPTFLYVICDSSEAEEEAGKEAEEAKNIKFASYLRNFGFLLVVQKVRCVKYLEQFIGFYERKARLHEAFRT